MKNLISSLPLILTIIILCVSCGLSNEDKKHLENTVSDKLQTMYFSKQITPMFLQTQLKDGKNPYTFICSFEDGPDIIKLGLEIEFEKNGTIKKRIENEPEYEISLITLMINNKPSSGSIPESKYDLPYFKNYSDIVK